MRPSPLTPIVDKRLRRCARRGRRRLLLLRVTGLFLLSFPATAEPYTPASDDEVIERLPPGLNSAELRRQRDDLASDPENLRDSLAMAESYLETAVAEGDSRFLGYTQAILGPWWDQVSPPAPVLVARARVRALQGEYDRALLDVGEALSREPGLLAALRLQFEVDVARGDFDRARHSLSMAGATLSTLARATLQARVDRMTGRASEAYEALAACVGEAVAPGGASDPAELHAARGLLADLALQLDRPNEARAFFDALMATGRRDVAQLAALADMHLDQADPGSVLALIPEQTGNDVLDQRLAEALMQLPSPDDRQVERRDILIRQIAARLDARRKRGEAVGLADDVRFRLRLVRDPGLARQRAGELWAVRRELSDVRWVLEAAAATGDAALARPVVTWLRNHSIQDARLQAALARWGESP